jgi:hypothetical protein
MLLRHDVTEAAMSGTGTFEQTRDAEVMEPESSRRRPTPAAAKLGEELPIFCERCGYSLHGLPQGRCEACTLLHFVCPECSHRQPINTLRPAFQRMLGRVRAAFLVAVVFFKINWFGWLLFAWFAMGAEWSYSYNYRSSAGGPRLQPRLIDMESMLAFALFGLPFGLVSRMLLLRWRRGIVIGAVLAALVVAASHTGAIFRGHIDFSGTPEPLSADFYYLLVIAAASIILGASVAWPIWTVLVRAFLPSAPGKALLDWQRSLSVRTASANGNATRGLDAPNPA